MPEPLTTIGVGAIAAYLSKDGISKLLGPTADYLGAEVKQLNEKRVCNLKKIFENAQKKSELKNDENLSVSPKVLKTIINEASYSDELISTEYFGGVLASSRTKALRDDRGARVAKIIDNLSSYQIRAHYIIYCNLVNIFKKKGYSVGLKKDRDQMQIYLPFEGFIKAMEFTDEELDNAQLLDHIFHGLAFDGLIDESWVFGDNKRLGSYTEFSSKPGIICQPSTLGSEIFLLACG